MRLPRSKQSLALASALLILGVLAVRSIAVATVSPSLGLLADSNTVNGEAEFVATMIIPVGAPPATPVDNPC